MKKILVMLMVLGMASLANATVIDVVTSGVGDSINANAGTIGDPLEAGETIAIKIVLNADDWVTSYYGGVTSSYDGYWLSSMNVSLTADSDGVLAEKGTLPAQKMKHSTGFSAWSEDEPAITANVVTQMQGVASGDGIQGPADLVWNLEVTANGTGDIELDLGMVGLTQYSVAPVSYGYPGGDTWLTAIEADLGDLTIYAVPEPMTMALLGLGGLGLIRRRRS